MTLSPQDASRQTRAICELAPIVPVLVIDDVHSAAALAKALVAGGLPALEVTLRTP
ncbi:MAG: 2-dehydro-3-deoxyphosphogluconate aldolase/(4S)-4-hydroxy-2-oxoglutarate aldolase, partial [Sulfitobacter sp.]